MQAICPKCEKQYTVSDDKVGRQTRCKSCGQRFRIAASADATQPATDTNRLHAPTVANTRASELGRFKVLAKCGEGAFGAVYRAYDTLLEREVALKLPHPGALDSEKKKLRILREPKAAAQLRHPNIVPIFDAGLEGQQFYIASAFIAGKTLKEVIESDRPNLRDAAVLLAKLASALAYAHRQGVIHRDVKPGNVMIDDKGEPLLLDFGLARLQEDADQLTYDGAVLGTPAYMAPEQAAGKHDEVGALSDQYSLGVVLYELLTGDRPFHGPPSLVVSLVINEQPAAPTIQNKTIPRDLETICLKAMSKEPDKRFSSCLEMAEDLQRWLEDRPVLARPTTPVERFWRWCRRNPLIAISSAVIVGLVMSVAVVMAVSYFREARLRHVADQARQAEADSREEAERQKEVAIEERRLATRNLAVSYLDRGRNLCEQSEVAHGLLWMAKGLLLLPDDEADLRRLARARIGAWEPMLHRRELSIQHSDRVADVKIAPSGDWFATASDDNTARLWEANTGQPIGTPLTHDDDVMCVAISPSGDRVLTTSKDRTARLWNVADQSRVGTPMRHQHWVASGDFTPDESKIITAGNDNTLALWKAATAESLRKRIRVPFPIVAMALSPDAKQVLVSGGHQNQGQNKDVQIWNVETEKHTNSLPHGRVRGIAFRHDGSTVATGGVQDSFVRFWDSATFAPVGPKNIQVPRGFNDLVFSPDDRLLATCSLDNTARIWSSSTGHAFGFPMYCDGAVRGVDFHPSGTHLLTGSDDGTASLWKLSDWKPEVFSFAHQSSVYGVAYCPTREVAITACLDNSARLWDTTTGELIGQPMTHGASVYYVALSANGELAVSGSLDRTARIWNAHDGSPIGNPLQHPRAVTGVAISPDSKLVLTGCEDRIARVFDIATGEKIAQTEPHPYRVFGVSFSPDGSRFATGCGEDTGPWVGELRVWTTGTCQVLSQPLLHENPIFMIQFVDNDSLWSASGDGTVRLWNAATSQQIGATLQHPGSVVGLALHPNANILATGCEDGRIRFWDTELHRPFGITYDHGADVMGLAFSGDGTKLFSGSKDQTARLWKTPVMAEGNPEEIEKRLQVATGLEILENGDLNVMQTDVWLQRQQQLLGLQAQ